MLTLSRPVQLYPKIPGTSFLKRLAECALKMTSYVIVDDGGSPGLPKDTVLELDIPEHPRHSRVSVIFAVTGGDDGPVAVEVKADQWSPALDYETYTSTVHQVVKPLLTRYNRTYRTRLRLGIPGPKKPVQLPDKAGRLLQKYLVRTTRGYAHSLDWGLFYDFVIHCHERRLALTAEELKKVLLTRGMPDDTAVELTEVYRHGRSLLKRRILPNWLV